MWPKPGHDKPVSKTSYVKGYDKWQWIIGSGIYLDDVEAVFQAQMVTDLLILGGVVLVLLVISYLIIHSITVPLETLVRTMNHVESSGDLSCQSGIRQSNELGKMAQAFDSMLARFRGLISQVTAVTDNLNGSSNTLMTVASQTARDVSEQQNKTDQIATAINEMSATVQEVARSTENASGCANDAYTAAKNGNKVVQATILAINTLANEVNGAADSIGKLARDSEDIGRVLDVIRGIAEQTNLLALNAAIEAARAGEQGRGFAVVADEVRTLAQRTQESTREIQSMIETLQSGTKEAGEAMQSGRDAAAACTEQASEAEQSLQSIIQAVQQINEQNTQIASAAEEQTAVATDIDRNVSSIAQIAHQSASNAQETAATCNAIGRMIQELESTLSHFKTG
jgi:methyl-accepting chemotaxis protein